MKIPIKTQQCARFKLRIKDAHGKIRLKKPYQKNLITDWGMEQMKGTTGVINNIRLGSGVKEYTQEDSYLDAEISSDKYTYDSNASSDSPAGNGYVIEEENNVFFVYQYYTASFTFNEAVNVSCLGLTGSVTTGDEMTTLARIKDSSGNPTTLSITSGETLEVTYENRTYYPYGIQDLGSINVLIDGVAKEYFMRGRMNRVAGSPYNLTSWLYKKTMSFIPYSGDLNEDLTKLSTQGASSLSSRVSISNAAPQVGSDGNYIINYSTSGTRKDHSYETPYVTLLALGGASAYTIELKDVDGLGIPVPTTSQFTLIEANITYGRYTGVLNPVDIS